MGSRRSGVRASLRRPPLLAFLALTAGLAGALVLLALLDAAIFRPIPGVRLDPVAASRTE